LSAVGPHWRTAHCRTGERRTAEEQGFDLFVTTDKNLRYQQDLGSRRIAILVLWTTSWPDLRPHAGGVALAGLAMRPGEYHELPRPA
jgi:hypothetical protein